MRGLYNKLSGIFFILFLLLSLFWYKMGRCEFRAPTHLINIPIAYSAGLPLEIGVNTSLSTGEEPHPTDINSYIEVEALKRATLGVSILTRRLVAMEVKVRVNNETARAPTFAIGCRNICADKWVSPVGAGKEIGWDDDQTYGHKRNSEQYSFFGIATKDLGPYGTYTLGIGRGEFVGYGPRSRYFNSDIFSRGHNNNAIGLFGGAEVPLIPPVLGVIEFDGRNFNIGIKIKTTLFQIGIAASKLEHRLGGLEWLYPRFAIGGTINYSLLKKWLRQPTGILTVRVTDAATGSPKRAIVTFPGTCVPPHQTDRSTGSCEILLEPGTYWVRVGIPGFFWADREVYVGAGGRAVVYFEIHSIVR